MPVTHAAHKNAKPRPKVPKGLETFRLTNGQIVEVKGLTQSELNSLHEALQRMLSAGATITRLIEVSPTNVQVQGQFNGNKGGLVGLFQKDFTAGLADIGFIKNRYSFSWNPAKSKVTKVQKEPGGTSGNPIGDPLGGLAGDIGKGLTTGLEAAGKDAVDGVINWVKVRPLETVLIALVLLLFLGGATKIIGREV